MFGPNEQKAVRTIHFGRESRSPPGTFARIEPGLVFIVDKPLHDALREAADTELESLRHLRLFQFAGFRAVALQVTSPGGDFLFQRREGEGGRKWTMEIGGSDRTVVDTVAVENLLYKLNSTDASGVGDGDLPQEGDEWIIAVTEEIGDIDGVETVRLTVSGTGEARALRPGDERTLAVSADAWRTIASLFATARTPAAEP